jgi:tripartite-type tricarboxylate transporter receptor subunit TctC
VVHPELPAKTTGELISLAQAKPGKLTYASAGSGSFAHILAELFKQAGRLEVLHVRYRGQPQAVTDLLAGRVDILFATMTVAIPQIEAGKLVGLGVTARRRLRQDA